MKICTIDRTALYRFVHEAFTQLDMIPQAAEIGVLRGDNASEIYGSLKPSKIWLIDKWAAVERFHHPFEERPFYIEPEETHDGYFGGPMQNQETFDRIFEAASARFAGIPEIEILRQDSMGAFHSLQKRLTALPRPLLDFIYIDADHEYEYVLRDLMYWCGLLSENGVLQLNDACFSKFGAAQNLGVLPAVTEFLKRMPFTPVLLTNTDWSDLVLARKNSRMLATLDQIVEDSTTRYVEVPPQLLPAMKVVYGKQRVNISFV